MRWKRGNFSRLNSEGAKHRWPQSRDPSKPYPITIHFTSLGRNRKEVRATQSPVNVTRAPFLGSGESVDLMRLSLRSLRSQPPQPKGSKSPQSTSPRLQFTATVPALLILANCQVSESPGFSGDWARVRMTHCGPSPLLEKQLKANNL